MLWFTAVFPQTGGAGSPQHQPAARNILLGGALLRCDRPLQVIRLDTGRASNSLSYLFVGGMLGPLSYSLVSIRMALVFSDRVAISYRCSGSYKALSTWAPSWVGSYWCRDVARHWIARLTRHWIACHEVLHGSVVAASLVAVSVFNV